MCWTDWNESCLFSENKISSNAKKKKKGTLAWVAISFSTAWKWKVKVKSLSRVRLLVTPWTVAHQAPPQDIKLLNVSEYKNIWLLWKILKI